MPEWNDDVKHFMTYWFAGFAEGLASLDAPARKTLLDACGRACARSYTAARFQEAWKNSAGMADFLAALSLSFPEAVYELVHPGLVRVRYRRCACDLVQLGLITSPLLCDCSAQNLQSNFAGALGKEVTVRPESSILRGAEECTFVVTLPVEVRREEV